MKELPTVRLAEPQEEEALMAQCRRLHFDNGLFALNEEKVRATIRRCFDRQGVIVGVIGAIGKIEASTCLAIDEYHYSNDWYLNELWNFVDEAYRRSRNAEALIEFGKSCAEKMGCPLLTGIITNKSMAGKVRLYRRLLGQPAGAFFVHNSKWKSESLEDHADLRRELRKWAQDCHDKRLHPEVIRKDISSLFRKAAEALGEIDDTWAAPKKNGARAEVTKRARSIQLSMLAR